MLQAEQLDVGSLGQQMIHSYNCSYCSFVLSRLL